MLPCYENRCHRQERQFEGVDLAKKWRKEICVRSLEISNDFIKCLGNGCFYVCSAADLVKMYLVDLSKDSSSDMSTTHLIENGKDSCNCPDWPRVRLCKHIATVAHFHTDQTNTPNPAPQEHKRSNSNRSPVSNASTVPILEKMINVSRDYLSDRPPSLPGTVQSLRLVESHLTAVIQHARSSQSPLPDRESVLPNQHTWTQTAEQMGAKRWKRTRPTNTLPTALATKQIGQLNRKQLCQGPSHGGSYMDEGTCHIRIELPPCIVSGDYLASSSMLPSLFAHTCSMSNVCDLGVVLVCLTYLVTMCVGARLHGILYPMMGCVLYLDRLLCC